MPFTCWTYIKIPLSAKNVASPGADADYARYPDKQFLGFQKTREVVMPRNMISHED